MNNLPVDVHRNLTVDLVTSESIGVILIWSTGVLGYFSSCWSRNTWLSTDIHMQNAMSRPFFQTVKNIVTIKIFYLPYLKNKNEKFRMVYLFFVRISLFLILHLNLNNYFIICIRYLNTISIKSSTLFFSSLKHTCNLTKTDLISLDL